METKKVKVAEQNSIITQLKQFASLGSDRQKNKHLKDLALPYFKGGLLSEKVYNCLLSYF